MRKVENQWFYCDVWSIKTTMNRCKNCSNSKKNPKCPEETYLKEMKLEQVVQEVRDMEQETCPNCGEYLVSSLYFAFCPNCGLPDDEDEDFEE